MKLKGLVIAAGIVLLCITLYAAFTSPERSKEPFQQQCVNGPTNITGYLVIHWLLRFLTGHTLYDFAIYCVAMGLIVLTLTYTRA